MVLQGYIDESGNDRYFTLSCLLARPEDWLWIGASWSLVLRRRNKALRRAGRKEIRRYHAADCSSCKGDFEGWTGEEQVQFAKDLLTIFHRFPTVVLAYTIPIDDFKEVFPEHRDRPYPQMYGFLMKFIMLEFIAFIDSIVDGQPHGPVHIELFHDRTNCGSDLLSAFDNMMRADPTFSRQELFSTITPVGWETCIPLQAADLIAYESFKDVENRDVGRPRRKSLKSILESVMFGGRTRSFTRSTLEVLRSALESGESSAVD